MTDPPADHVAEFARIREREFPGVVSGTYLNAASFAPIPQRTRRVLHDFDDRRAEVASLTDEDLTGALHDARSAAAKLVGADPEEIALGGNASFGINLAAQSLPVERGSSIVISDREFPANVYPWMGRPETRLEIVPTDAFGLPDEDRLLERLDRGDVSIFAVSAVQFSTGYRADLVELGRFCRARGIFFVVDAIQALGQIPIDVRDAEIDLLATGGQKWLCSPFGTGFTYVRRRLIERMEPVAVGWTGMEACASLDSLTDYRWSFRSDARRFEGGTLAFDRFAGFAAALDLFAEVGVPAIELHWRHLLDPLVTWLSGAPEVEVLSDLRDERRSAILCFRPPEAERVYRSLQGAGIICAFREGAIRVAPHLYNNSTEIGSVIEVLDAARSGGWT